MSYGGPIKRDRLWFYGSIRQLNTETAVEGIVANANAGNLARWDWVTRRQPPGTPDAGPQDVHRPRHGAGDQPSTASTSRTSIRRAARVRRCDRETEDGCHTRGASWIASAGATTSPEAATSYIDFPYYLTQALWTAPMTNKILLEAGYSRLSYEHAGGPGQLPPDGIFGIGVTEQSTTANPAIGYANPVPRANYVYRALSQYADNWSNPNHWRASASYVTGSHSMKVGYQGSLLINETSRVRNDRCSRTASIRACPIRSAWPSRTG